jgi:hypothetical protein
MRLGRGKVAVLQGKEKLFPAGSGRMCGPCFEEEGRCWWIMQRWKEVACQAVRLIAELNDTI